MIRNRLAELLAERQLKISKVANDIEGLSRNTITATAQNNGKMIQLETIDKLCQYLGININEFFEYLPFDVKVNLTNPNFYTNLDRDGWGNIFIYGENITVPSFDMDLYVEKIALSKNIGIKKHTFDLTVRISDTNFSKNGWFSTAVILLGQNNNKESFNNQKNIFSEFFNSLGVGFENTLITTITNKIKESLEKILEKNNIYCESEGNHIDVNVITQFTLEDAYSQNTNEVFKILKSGNNNSNYINNIPTGADIDISDDDLPF